MSVTSEAADDMAGNADGYEGQDSNARAREELKMLFIGFGTGLSIGVIFLIYIILATAGVLP